MKKISFTFFATIILGIMSCEPWDFEELNFLKVNTIVPSTVSSNSVQMRGSIEKAFDRDRMITYGFCWSLADPVPDKESNNTNCISLTDFDPTIEFTYTLKNLPFDTILNVRAFASLDNRIFYGEVKSIQTSQIELTVEEVFTVDFQTVIAEGTILGLGPGTTEVAKYGHCWSQVATNPTIDCPSCHYSDFAPSNRSENGYFISNISNLQPGKEYFIRSYAIYNTENGIEKIFYSNPAQTFRISDVWEPKDDFQKERFGAASFTLGNYGYIGLGYDKSVRFTAAGIAPIRRLIPTNEFFKYSFATNSWSLVNSVDWVPTGEGRLHTVSFVVDGKAFVGTGYAPPDPLVLGSEAIYYNDFWVFNGTNWSSEAIQFDGGSRFGAVAFSLNGKGYVGLGQDENGIVLNDFWEYNPETPGWIPFPNFPGSPRWGATSFVVNDTAYIGLGQGESGDLYRDFYRFDGCCWSLAAEFPGEERKGATGLAIGNKGYVGMGENSSGLALSDFWVFNPGAQVVKWEEQTGIGSIGQIRTFSSSLEYGNRGFIGMGLAKASIIEHSFEYELSLFDFFEYFPQE